MKAIKFFVAAMAMAFAMNANAKIFEDNHFMVNANVGGIKGPLGYSEGGFGLGAGFQTTVYEGSWASLAWDVLQFEWNAPFDSPGDIDWINFKTGIRAFSPSFAKDHLRVYTNFDLGYTNVLIKEFDRDIDDGVLKIEEEMKGHSAFGLAWGIGLQLNKKISLGYTLEYDTFTEFKKHFATIGYTF